MKVTESEVKKLVISEVDSLDPITVFLEDWNDNRQGKITITCYSKSWSSYWGGMGAPLVEFFCSCDEHYIAKNLSDIDSEVFDADKINEDAEKIGKNWGRDEPWNDWDLMAELYGSDMCDWHYKIPKKSNYEYDYLCRIIKTVQEALRTIN